MIGSTVSHYRILAKLGEGGMGVVYKAEDTRLERMVALKFLPDAEIEDKARERFLREARAAAQVHHPNICPIHEIDEVDGRLFFTMALVDGSTVRQLLERGDLTPAKALDIAIQVTSGLQAAHSQGVIHRDIKSSNIAVDRQGNVSILDFGVALRSGDSRVTQPGNSVGTPAYMSPEQALGNEVDCRMDLWSAGVVLFEMLTGRLPFIGETNHAMLFAIVHQKPPQAAGLRASVPAGMQRVLDRALAKDPADRYQTASQMGADLRALRESASDVTRSLLDSVPVRQSRPWPRRALIASPFVLAAGVLVGRRMLTPGVKNVAVLPFEVIGGDEGTRALADGLVESLTSKLTQLEAFQGKLMVIPASEIRSRHVTSAATAQRLYDANLVITGSAQRMGDRLQFTLNLVDTRSMRQIASRTIELGSDPIALRNAAIGDAVDILQISVAPEASRAMGAGETSTPEAYAKFLMGTGYLARYDVSGNITRAIESLRNAVELDPKYALAWAALGTAYLRAAEGGAGTTELALDAVQRAIDLNPDMPSAYVTRVSIDIAQNRLEDAIADAMHARRIAPNDGAACFALGSAFEASGRMKEAEAAYREAVERRPSDWYAHVLLGVFCLDQSKFREARVALEAARALTPDNEVVNRNLAALNMAEGRYADAEQQLKRALQFEPSARSFSTLGLTYYYRHRYREGAEYQKKALELHSGLYSIWGNLGTIYRWIPGQNAREIFQKAIDMGNKALQAAPGNNNTHANLAEYYAKIGSCGESMDHIAQIPAAVRGRYMTRIALAYEVCGKRAEAIETVRSLLQNAPALNDIEHDPDFAKLWADPAFQSAIRLRGFAPK